MTNNRMCGLCKYWKNGNKRYCTYCDNIIANETKKIESAITEILENANFPHSVIENKLRLNFYTNIEEFDICEYFEANNNQNKK